MLAFPCNQFGNQEPGDATSIKDFARKRCPCTNCVFLSFLISRKWCDHQYAVDICRYGVTFPIFKKVGTFWVVLTLTFM